MARQRCQTDYMLNMQFLLSQSLDWSSNKESWYPVSGKMELEATLPQSYKIAYNEHSQIKYKYPEIEVQYMSKCSTICG